MGESLRIAITTPRFAWDALEDSPSLQSLRILLESIPDQEVLDGLRVPRGKGRHDDPVEVLWGTLLLAIALRHLSIEAGLAELRRTPALRWLLGIEAEDKVAGPDNRSRFLATLGAEPHLTPWRRSFDTQVGRLGAVIDDFGKDTAGDSTGLAGRAAVSEKLRAAETEPDLPQSSGGRKEYKDDEGNVTKVIEWHGSQLPFLVDVAHEVALATHITATKAGDNERIPDLVSQARHHRPPDRIETLAYDKAADDGAVQELLPQEGIQPVRPNRNFQVEEPATVLGGSTPWNIGSDQAATVYCYDCVSPQPVRHPMALLGHEPQRGTFKDRGPARPGGWSGPSDARCNGARKYGLTVRVKPEIDRRRFPSLPGATKQLERQSKGRTAVERVQGRRKVFGGIDDGPVSGARGFPAHLGAVMVVPLGFATLLAQAGSSEGSYGKLTVTPIAKALQELIRSQAPQPEPAAASVELAARSSPESR